MKRLLAVVLPVMVITLVGGCVTAQRNTTSSLCAYHDEALGIFDQLQGRGLSRITEYSSPAEVATYGRSGEGLTNELLDSWHRLNPPPEARLWHDSMEEWITTVSGGFATLTVAESRPPDEVTRVVGSYLQVMGGMTYELNQLDMQAQRLFSECK